MTRLATALAILFLAIGITPLPAFAGPPAELLVGAKWCRLDLGANKRSRELIDKAINTESVELGLVGYISCQQHQLCAVDKKVAKKYQDYVKSFSDKAKIKNALHKLAQKKKNEDDSDFTKLVKDIASFIDDIAIPIGNALNLSCKGKTGQPIRDIEKYGKDQVWLALKCEAHTYDKRCK